MQFRPGCQAHQRLQFRDVQKVLPPDARSVRNHLRRGAQQVPHRAGRVFDLLLLDYLLAVLVVHLHDASDLRHGLRFVFGLTLCHTGACATAGYYVNRIPCGRPAQHLSGAHFTVYVAPVTIDTCYLFHPFDNDYWRVDSPLTHVVTGTFSPLTGMVATAMLLASISQCHIGVQARTRTHTFTPGATFSPLTGVVASAMLVGSVRSVYCVRLFASASSHIVELSSVACRSVVLCSPVPSNACCRARPLWTSAIATPCNHMLQNRFKSFVSGYLIRHVPAESLAGCATVMP